MTGCLYYRIQLYIYSMLHDFTLINSLLLNFYDFTLVYQLLFTTCLFINLFIDVYNIRDIICYHN